MFIKEAFSVFLATTAKTDLEKTLKMNCSYCDKKPGTLGCSGCKLRAYCSKECQRSSWKCGHKEECALFQQETEKTRIHIQKMNQLLDQLKVKPTKETCIICYKECSMPELSQLPCKHSFCSNCLCQTPHEPYKLPCPLCRSVCNPEQSVFGFANLDLLLEAFIIYQRCNIQLAKQFMYHAKREYARLKLLEQKINLPNEYIFVYYRIHIAILEKKYHEAIRMLDRNKAFCTKETFTNLFLKGHSTSRLAKSLLLSMALLSRATKKFTSSDRNLLIEAYNEPGNEKTIFLDQEILYQLVEINIEHPEVAKHVFELFRHVDIALDNKLCNCNGIYCLMGGYYEQQKEWNKAISCYKLSIRYDYRLLECDQKILMKQKICSAQEKVEERPKNIEELKSTTTGEKQGPEKKDDTEMARDKKTTLDSVIREIVYEFIAREIEDDDESEEDSDEESGTESDVKETPDNKQPVETKIRSEDANNDNHRPKKRMLHKSCFHFKS